MLWREDNAGTEDVPLCQNCYDERYTSCCDCGTLLHIANANGERMYIKHNGSLDDGLELVTHPLFLSEHLHHFLWEALCKKAAALGYLSHRATTCGLHIHVSRRAFGEGERQQDAAIARILYFFEKHWEELLKFSRRTRRQLEQWASRYGYMDQPMENPGLCEKGLSRRALHLCEPAKLRHRGIPHVPRDTEDQHPPGHAETGGPDL